MPEGTNGTVHKGGVCSHRNNGEGHCFHASGSPYKMITGNTVVFPSVCCFCAPDWMHFDIFMDSRVTDEDLIAAQMLHGPRVTVDRQPKPGPRIATLGR
jgi:hypothetical protein